MFRNNCRIFCLTIYLLVLSFGVLFPRTGGAQDIPAVSNELFPVAILADTQEVLRYIGNGRAMQDRNTDSAEILLFTALRNSRRMQFATGIKQSLTTLANIYISRGSYSEAIRTYHETIRYCHDVPGLHPALYAMYNNLANVYIKQGDYRQAIANYRLAITALEKYKTPNSGEVYNNLGGLLIQTRQYEQVLYYLNKAEEAAIANRDTVNLSSVYGNKTSYFFETDQWDTSVHYARKALGLARIQGNRAQEFLALVNTGELYRRGGRAREALKYLVQAKELSAHVLPVFRNQLAVMTGNAYLDLKQYALAESFFRTALQESVLQQQQKNIMNAYSGLAKTYEQTGRYRESLEAFREFYSTEKKVADDNLLRSISEWELKYRSSEKDKELMAGKMEISQQKNELRTRNYLIAAISSCSLLLAITFGSFYRASRQKRRWQQQQIDLLQQLRELEELKAIIKGEERERERMARELHDGIGGMLAAIRMNLSDVRGRQKDPADDSQLSQVLQMLEDTSAEVRRTVHNLLPDVLTQHSLEEALTIYCAHLNLGNTIRIHFQFHADTSTLDKSAELFLYRISQELLQNIVKHARAANAWLMIKELNGKLSIIVEDDGAGFDPAAASSGYGLLNLQYRVKALQGTINIQSDPSRGTTVHIAFDKDRLNKKETA